MQPHTPTLLATALLLAGPYGFAQDPPSETAAPTAQAPAGKDAEVQALRQEVQELKVRLDKTAATSDIAGVQTDLENFKYQYQRDRDTKSALSNRNLLITGVIQSRYSHYSENLSTSTGYSTYASTSVNNPSVIQDRKSSFDTPVGQLIFSGLLYRDYESARNLGFNFSLTSTAGSSNYGAGTSNTNAFLSILDANVVYQALPTIENDGDRLSLTIGQQLTPFGLEANTNDELRPVINNALFVAPTTFNTRQVGAIVKGEFFSQYDFGYNYRQSIVTFALGVLNGNGPNRGDDNNHKDFIGRVAITVPAQYQSWLRELRVGASVYKGKANILNAASTAFVDYGAKSRYGYDIYYNHYPFGFTYEYVHITDDVQAGSTTASLIKRYDRKGSTATFFYSFGEQFLKSIKTQGKFDDWWPKTYQPFIRYDDYDPNAAATSDKIRILTTGLNIFFAETTKAQINYNRRNQEVSGKANVKSNELLLQLQFGF